MEEEDKEFFVLVLGVLAAIILVVSWWYMSGGLDSTPQGAAPVAAQTDEEVDDGGEEAAEAEPTATAVPEPEPEEEPEEEEFALEPAEEEPEPEPEPEPTVEEEIVALPATVFDAIANRSDLGVIGGLLRDEGLDQTLAGPGPFTVFAPSDDAISQAAASDTTVAVLEANRPAVLTYHVVPGRYSAEDLVELARGGRAVELETVQGEPIFLSLDGDNVIVNGTTVVTAADEQADNGVVHTIDNVLVPSVAALNAIVGAEPILFDSGSANIRAESLPTLDRMIEVLNTSTVQVDIEGHTDNTGDPILNQNLSQSRARSVLNYLVANGIEESRLSATGYGPDQPVADNDTEEGRALNRRIEFRLNG